MASNNHPGSITKSAIIAAFSLAAGVTLGNIFDSMELGILAVIAGGGDLIDEHLALLKKEDKSRFIDIAEAITTYAPLVFIAGAMFAAQAMNPFIAGGIFVLYVALKTFGVSYLKGFMGAFISKEDAVIEKEDKNSQSYLMAGLALVAAAIGYDALSPSVDTISYLGNVWNYVIS